MVLEQHTLLDFYSASPPIQQSADRQSHKLSRFLFPASIKLNTMIDKLKYILLKAGKVRWGHVAGFELTTLVVIGTGCLGSCKSNYHTITTTMARRRLIRKNQYK